MNSAARRIDVRGQKGDPAFFKSLAAPAIIAVLVWACFAQVLGNDFVNWDDPSFFLNNPDYRGLSPVNLGWMFTTFHEGHYQPMSWLVHGLVYSFYGMDPRGYHLASLLAHTANAVLVFFFCRAMLRLAHPRAPLADPRSGLGLQVAATFGALVFALHPLRVEAVAWATDFHDLLCTSFILLSALSYLKGVTTDGPKHRRLWLAASVLCFTLSLMSKASAMMFPVALLALDVYPLRRTAGYGRWRFPVTVLLEKVPFLLPAIAAGVVALLAKKTHGLLPAEAHALGERAVQAAYGPSFYLWKTLLPTGLSPLYLLERTIDPSRPKYLLSVLLVACISISVLAIRRRHPWAPAAWISHIALLLPVLGLVPYGPQIAADRFTYLASLPIAVLGSAGALHLWLLRSRVGPALSALLVVCAAAALASLGTLTIRQTGVWKTTTALWTRAIEVDPTNYYAFYNRGVELRARGEFDLAISDFDAALSLNTMPNESAFHRALADVHYGRGNALKSRGDIEGAIADFDEVIRFEPDHVGAFNNRGDARRLRGDLAGALWDFNRAIALDPRYAKAYNNRGSLRWGQGDASGAMADLNEAVRLDSGYTLAYSNRGVIRQAQGDVAGALGDFERALQLSENGPARATIERRAEAARRQLAAGKR